MKKIFFAFIFVILLFGIFAVAAEEVGVSPEVSAAVEKTGSGLSDKVKPEVSGFIQDFVEKRGIDAENITNIERVDFNALPKEVNIENVGDNNLAIYQVDYNGTKGNDKVYVISYSVEKLNAQGDLIIAQDKREFLDFGHSGEMSASGFLNTATGVETSLEKGYVMPRDGSITAVSTNLDVSQNGVGSAESIEIIIYKNGEQVNFGNTLDAGTVGVKKDYDVQSKGTVVFGAGDVISVYARVQGDIAWKDVITIVEITSTN